MSSGQPSVNVFTSPGKHAQQSFGIGTAGPSQLPTQHWCNSPPRPVVT